MAADASEGGADAGAVESPSFELGQGERRYRRAPDGSDIQLHAGPQGGYHVFVGVRVRWPARRGTSVRLVLRAWDETGRLLAQLRFSERFDEQGRLTRVGIPLVLDIGAPDEVVGRALRVRAELTCAPPAECSRADEHRWRVRFEPP